jgi:hypothetical protein
MRPTLDEIHRRGLEALREKLGRAGMIRFLQQFEIGHGDYAKERHDWVDRTTLDELRALASQPPTTRRKSKSQLEPPTNRRSPPPTARSTRWCTRCTA